MINNGEKMKIDKKKENGLLFVSVEMDMRSDKGEKEKINTTALVKLLKEEEPKLEIVKAIRSSMVCNYNPKSLKGLWVFELLCPKQPVKVEAPAPKEEVVPDEVELPKQDFNTPAKSTSTKRNKSSKKNDVA